ncbi:MAG: PhoH family protein [Eubacteriales bacterium]|nr:PhoH family protein [Eubacteriales bacterium]
MIEKTIRTEQPELLMTVFGAFDENLKLLERELHVSVVSRGDELKLSGEPTDVETTARTLEALLAMAARGEAVGTQTVQYVIGLARDGREAEVHTMARDVLCITAKGKPVKAKTLGQKRYMEAIGRDTVVIGVGPAGTGKTYLAVAAAVAAFRDKRVSRIILTRPAVEAGEKLGFLPGDLQSKVDPYLRPLYDGLFDMLGAENFAKYQERGSIEVAPLAYMRGRTLDDSFIILDEAQNTTPEQMKMFLTRLGFGSQAVITGDITQIDLPDGKASGLKEALHVLRGVEGISQCFLTEKDVVRHELVQRIVKAYAEHESKKSKGRQPDERHPALRRRGERR